MSTDPKTKRGDPEAGQLMEKQISIPFPENFTYVNCAAFAISHMELRIGFAEAMQTGAAAPGSAVPRVGIVLTPEAAAAIALIMVQQLQTYEKNFGEIRHPDWKAARAALSRQVSEPL